MTPSPYPTSGEVIVGGTYSLISGRSEFVVELPISEERINCTIAGNYTGSSEVREAFSIECDGTTAITKSNNVTILAMDEDTSGMDESGIIYGFVFSIGSADGTASFSTINDCSITLIVRQ